MTSRPVPRGAAGGVGGRAVVATGAGVATAHGLYQVAAAPGAAPDRVAVPADL